jgi:magnesium-transporting ATPase (P-type)
LTGENEAVRKAAVQQNERENKSPFELENIVFMGTSVISGNGLALVLRTGDGESWSFMLYEPRVISGTVSDCSLQMYS